VPATPAAHPVPAPADATGAPPDAAGAGASRPRPPIVSESLFGGAREVQILHRGSLYRLKQTALGKLILTK
jgi:hemin uptake protein HemP